MTLQLGSSGPVVAAWQRTMVARFKSYALAADGGPLKADSYFGADDAAVASEWQRRMRRPVTGTVSDDELAILGVAAPKPPRHAGLTFSGTWAAPGTGYPSWVAQACQDVVEEVPVQSPWSFGFVGGPANAPSYRQSVHIAVEWAVNWLLAHPTRTFMLGGYSQGAEAASRVYAELLPGGRLEALHGNYVCGYALGNPCRQASHTFYGGRDPGGSGISSFNLTNMGNEWLDAAQPGDIYTTKPSGQVGKIMQDVYEMAIDLQLNDPLAFMQAFVGHILAMAQDLGLAKQLAGMAGGGLLGGLVGGSIGAMLPAALIPLLGGVLRDAVTGNGLAAAVQAAIIGLKFVADNPPTRAHITYEFGEAIPGMTYIDLARQHVRDWGTRVPVRVAA